MSSYHCDLCSAPFVADAATSFWEADRFSIQFDANVAMEFTPYWALCPTCVSLVESFDIAELVARSMSSWAVLFLTRCVTKDQAHKAIYTMVLKFLQANPRKTFEHPQGGQHGEEIV